MDLKYADSMNLAHDLTATYQELVKAFGDGKTAPRDTDKQKCQWNIETSHDWVEIYDYKLYGVKRKDITAWRVQGKNKEAIEEMLQMLRSAN